MDVIETLYARRSIRSYQDSRIDHEIINTLLKAAMAAPTAVNAQPWEFVVTDEAEQLARIKEACVFARYNTPVAIVVCGNMKLALKGPDRDLWVQDCSAAITNLLTAATSLGLGSVWIGVHPIQARVEAIQRIFDMPEYVIPMSIVYVGYPAEERKPRTQYNEKRIYWQRYDPKRKHRSKGKPDIGHH